MPWDMCRVDGLEWVFFCCCFFYQAWPVNGMILGWTLDISKEWNLHDLHLADLGRLSLLPEMLKASPDTFPYECCLT